MKKITLLLLIVFIFACSKKSNDVTVKVNIKDLKKGTVYLKKIIDSSLVTLDSVVVNGKSEIELYCDIDSPEVLYVYLDKNSSEEDRIAFFADKGITEINTTLKSFVFDAKINGSQQQKTWEEFKSIMSRLNNQSLDLIKESFESQREGDSIKADSIQVKQNQLLKRKYLYTVNFSLNNKDSEVAPYLALTEIYNARIKYLDTINNSLTPKVKASKYGKKLQDFIDKIKKTEQE